MSSPTRAASAKSSRKIHLQKASASQILAGLKVAPSEQTQARRALASAKVVTLGRGIASKGSKSVAKAK